MLALQLFGLCCVQYRVAPVSLRFCPGPGAPNHLVFPCLNFDIHHAFVLAGWSHTGMCNAQWKILAGELCRSYKLSFLQGRLFKLQAFLADIQTFSSFCCPCRTLQIQPTVRRLLPKTLSPLNNPHPYQTDCDLVWYVEPLSAPFPLALSYARADKRHFSWNCTADGDRLCNS